MDELRKFIPFVKVDSVRREVSGIVTAERPDKDREVCDYTKSKPYYQQWSDEFRKTTNGISCGNLRAMHQLDAVGKAIDLTFNDPEKEILMTFKVVDDDAWKKVEERVYTGFSQGGRKVGDTFPDPVFKGCMRYVASPSEVSLVDNPCLPDAHFAYVKADGSVEMRKFLKTETPPDQDRIATLEQEVKLLKAAAPAVPAAAPAAPAASAAPPPVHAGEDVNKTGGKTKRVAGEDLPASAFAYVGDPEKTDTWKLPIRFSSDSKTKSHIRNALARFNQTQGIPAGEKSKVLARIKSAARKHGIDVSSENDKVAAISSIMRKTARAYVNSRSEKISSTRLRLLDSDLGKLSKLAPGAELTKGMFEVSRMASLVQDIACLLHCVACEQDYEGDADSELPSMLAENISALTETFLEMVNEETKELLAEVKIHAA